jgi:hypothetical protein
MNYTFFLCYSGFTISNPSESDLQWKRPTVKFGITNPEQRGFFLY